VPPPSEGPSGATVEAAGGSPQIRQGGRSAAQSARTRAGLGKRRPRSPRSPALGRTHNDGAPVPKLGQGPLFGNCDIYHRVRPHDPSVPCSIRRCCIERRCSLNDADTHEPNANRCMAISRRRAAEIRYAHCGKTASSEPVRPWSCDCSLTLWNAVGGVTAPPTA
jgi:hypothetical protein